MPPKSITVLGIDANIPEMGLAVGAGLSVKVVDLPECITSTFQGGSLWDKYFATRFLMDARYD